ncbi:class I mannose-6-phosphate isomerase [Breznakiella homolactica]|uniref:Class I mannose-6-phosphate isomerase n=1 Tax=Breznakiella homolactica TaxID=2798577 RepID=A0A7T7XK86_9SPIR|nr:class I mannose-6-phosphate isomerase [Breznakiella homolactica]QQO07934.1 class I mannose-6-phosphate isomerase [Breznakiella homolactica]
MSFMFNPFPYDDYSAVNTPRWEGAQNSRVITGNLQSASHITKAVLDAAKKKSSVVVGIDGYATAQFDDLVRLISRNIFQAGLSVLAVPVSEAYKDADVIESQFSQYLPRDTDEDPPLLYGRLFHGREDSFFDNDRFAELLKTIGGAAAGTVVLVYGNFTGTEKIREKLDFLAYIDVIPKNAVLRLKSGRAANIGTSAPRTYRELMRRSYYVDFETSLKLRGELLKSNEIDWYIAGNDEDNLMLVEWDVFRKACDALVKQPFRCKPVYNEGVWGGYYVMHYRNLPETMKNCAWVFDLIPSEVSLVLDIGGTLVDIPFYTFIRMEAVKLLGKESVAKFGEYFPMRFNYDDTMHSSGNMSIQVHPGEAYSKEHFDELGRQDESYYVVAAGMGAKTYCGFRDGADSGKFVSLIKESEKTGKTVPYDDYVHAEQSVPGMQFLLPAGTIHASGRNQLILEIGSLTVGSYTFKMYDYMRKDLDGTPRPIHSAHGERVLEHERNGSWVRENLVVPPRDADAGDGWKEVIVGEHDLLYFSLRRIEFLKAAKQDTKGKFHVLCLADGESVRVVSEADDSLCYTMRYLDIIVVPAEVGAYRIENLGSQPAAVHKTVLK